MFEIVNHATPTLGYTRPAETVPYNRPRSLNDVTATVVVNVLGTHPLNHSAVCSWLASLSGLRDLADQLAILITDTTICCAISGYPRFYLLGFRSFLVLR